MTKIPLKFPWQLRLFDVLMRLYVFLTRRRDGTVRRSLANLLSLRVPPSSPSTSDHVVDPTRNLSVRIFSPTSTDTATTTIVYFHGGGFVLNSPFMYPYDSFCRRLSLSVPARVVSVHYRLAPENKIPAAYDDCHDVLTYLDTLAAGPTPVFLAGESAGGNIAHHVALRRTPFKNLTVSGVIALQPFFGGEEDTESEAELEGVVPLGWREMYTWMWRCYLPEGASLDHEAANVFGPGSRDDDGREKWEGFPATMVAIGECDTLKDRQRWYGQGLMRNGVEVRVREYANAIHGFQFFEFLPEAKALMEDIVEFVRRRTPNY